MEQLVDQLATLDPDASARLKVIAYFDSLVDGHAGVEACLRGAAMLSGCPAGVVWPERRIRMRVDEEGARVRGQVVYSPDWASQTMGHDGDGKAWIERTGPAHANDAMVLERLAASLRVTVERIQATAPVESDASVEALLSDTAAPGVRDRAARLLHLDSSQQVRVLATPPDDDVSAPALSTIMPTIVGPVRAVLESKQRRLPRGAAARAGVGHWVSARDLPASWKAAVTALRLTSIGQPWLHIDDVGPMSVLAAGVDALSGQDAGPPPDVDTLQAIVDHHDWASATLEALGTHDSIRSAAHALNIHHSTAQSRCERLEEMLGYSLRTQAGRTRITLALALYRLTHTRYC